jgi:nucleotide-binding universal stress UspA family protein
MTTTLEAGSRVAFKNILFGTDFSSCSDAAFSYARSIARRYGATLNVAHVMPTMASMLVLSPEFGMDAAVQEDERVQGYIEQLERQMETVPHHVLTPRGKVADELARIIEEQNIDLLVLGTHGRTGVRRLIMGSVAEETFRRASCPVLSVGPNASCERPEARFRHILFATDFSRDSLAALPYAISFAEENEAGLTLLHFVEQPAGNVSLRTKKVLLHRLEELIPADARLRYRCQSWVEFGELFVSPAQGILDVAERREVDLIVLGVRAGRGSLGLTTHLSTVTARLLTQARCPVLTVRAPL